MALVENKWSHLLLMKNSRDWRAKVICFAYCLTQEVVPELFLLELQQGIKNMKSATPQAIAILHKFDLLCTLDEGDKYHHLCSGKKGLRYTQDEYGKIEYLNWLAW